MTAPSWAEARKVEAEAYAEVTGSYRELGQTKAEIECGHSKQHHMASIEACLSVDEGLYLAARRASDVALVREVLLVVAAKHEHVYVTKSTGEIFDRKADDIDPSAVLAEIEKENT